MTAAARRQGDPPRGRRRRWLCALFAIVATLALAAGLFRLLAAALARHGLQFAGAEIATYLLVAGGLGFLLLFAFLAGHFSDIERPKFDLLDSERRRDREEYGGDRP